MVKEINASAFSEFGVTSISSMECLKSFMPEVSENGKINYKVWEAHHGINAGDHQPETHSNIPDIMKIYGETNTLEQTINASQVMQCFYYKSIFEEICRKKAESSIALNWDFCDCWPTAANNSIIENGGRKKLAYFGIKESLKDTILSISFNSFVVWENIFVDIWLLNDGIYKKKSNITVTVKFGNQQRQIQLKANSPLDRQNLYLGKYLIDVSFIDKGEFIVKIDSDNDTNLTNRYTLLKKRSNKKRSD